jgi:hypothetical protein
LDDNREQKAPLVNGSARLRAAVTGMVALAGSEETALLAAVVSSGPEQGDPRRWAARPLVAHNTEFKRQQVHRLEAIRRGETPPEFPQIDHSSQEVYRAYSEQSDEAVLEGARATTLALIEQVERTCDADLVDASRHAWLAGRQLWLQIVVRGFWHPTGHLCDYYLAHGQAHNALALGSRGDAFSDLLSLPDQARGMAKYNLACAQARSGLPAIALETLEEALRRNPDLADNARRDPDLDLLRRQGHLEGLLGGK